MAVIEATKSVNIDSGSLGNGMKEDNPLPDPESLVRENIAWMLSLARRILGNHRELADDTVQNAFIHAFRALDNLSEPAKLKPWLRRITINSALTELRTQNRQAEQPIDELLSKFHQNDCRIEDRWSFLARADDVMENHHLRSLIENALEQLPESYRLVLQLRDVEGYDTNETAELLQTTPSNVKIRLHRARSAMKKLIEPVLRGDVT